MNEVKRIISNGNSICFIIQTVGDKDFWWWEIDVATWELYWKNKNPKYITGRIDFVAANEFVNSDECSHCGCSCASFDSEAAATKDYMKN